MPNLRPWLEAQTGVDFKNLRTDEVMKRNFAKIPQPKKNEAFLTAIGGHYKSLTFDDEERIHHSHGHTAEEIYTLCYGEFKAFVDVVIWPESHAQVEAIVKAAGQQLPPRHWVLVV